MKEIYLTKNQIALVDNEDFLWLNQQPWIASWHESGKTFYAYGRENGKAISMHRIIMDAQKSLDVDHINHNGLDNRRHNLCIVTRSLNNRNNRKRLGASSQYKGVCWHKVAQKWMASIQIEGKSAYLGCFINEEDAALAYDKAAQQWYGEHTLCNFNEDGV